MCLNITEESLKETEALKEADKPIIAYKLIDSNGKSLFRGFDWPEEGEVVSNRTSTELVQYEKDTNFVYKGFHFFVEEPKDCLHPYRCRGLCRRPHRYLYQYRCIDKDPVNKVLKVKIDPKDLVAVGTWEGNKSLVAIKCTVIKEE